MNNSSQGQGQKHARLHRWINVIRGKGANARERNTLLTRVRDGGEADLVKGEVSLSPFLPLFLLVLRAISLVSPFLVLHVLSLAIFRFSYSHFACYFVLSVFSTLWAIDSKNALRDSDKFDRRRNLKRRFGLFMNISWRSEDVSASWSRNQLERLRRLLELLFPGVRMRFFLNLTKMYFSWKLKFLPSPSFTFYCETVNHSKTFDHDTLLDSICLILKRAKTILFQDPYSLLYHSLIHFFFF